MLKSATKSGASSATLSPVLPIGAFLLALYIIAYPGVIANRPLFIPDEPRYAQIPGEMIANNDWLTLKQAGLRYYEKPPLGYWLNALSISLFGQTNFAVRLPSALAAGIAALAVCLLAIRVRKDRLRGLLAAAVYLSSVEVFGIGTFAVLDSMFCAFVVLTMVFYACAEFGPENRRRTPWIVLAGAACSAAFLTKGFTAIVLPALSLTAWMCWQRRFRELAYFWLLPTAVAVAATLPAALTLHKANPDFWRYFVWVEHIGRFVDPHGGQHDQPAWFFIPILLVGALPWSFFLPITAVNAYRDAPGDAFTRYCVCWFILPFLFFSACGGKLPTYILPCFASLAILTVDAILGWKNSRHLRRAALIGAGTYTVALIGFLAWLPFSKQEHLRETLQGSWKTMPLAASILLAVACLCLAARRLRDSNKRIAGIVWTALSLFGMALASFLFLPDGFGERESPQRLISEMMPQAPENAYIVTERGLLSTVCWEWRKTDDITFFGSRGELQYGLDFPEGEKHYVATAREAGERAMAELAKGRPVVAVLGDDEHANLLRETPGLKPVATRSRSIFHWTLFSPETEGMDAGE